MRCDPAKSEMPSSNAFNRLAIFVIAVPGIATVSLEQWESLIIFGPLAAGLVIYYGIGLKRLAGISMFIMPMLVLVSLQVFIRGAGERKVLMSAPFAIYYYEDSIPIVLLIVSRTIIAVIVGAAVMHGILLREFIEVLEKIGVTKPAVICMSIMLNFLHIFRSDVSRFLAARRARQLNSSYLDRIKLPAGSVGALFLRAVAAAERIYIAMRARGYSESAGRSEGNTAVNFTLVSALMLFIAAARIWAVRTEL